MSDKRMSVRELKEIILKMPDEFLANEHTRGFYGDLVHNSKAVYQRYLSWYDGNPANLNKLPPVEVGQRYVALAGGADKVIAAGREALANGDYRWGAELVNHLVFADPTNTEARALQADLLEQLGYQSESSTFRNAYLTGAPWGYRGWAYRAIDAVAELFGDRNHCRDAWEWQKDLYK